MADSGEWKASFPDERSQKPVSTFAAIRGSRHRGCDREAGAGCAGSRPVPGQRAGLRGQDRGLDEEKSIATFLHAARLGLFELSWNVLCPSCGGVLDASSTLRSMNRAEYHCAWCAAGYEPILDEIVEVTFTVNRRVRRIAAHDPNELPFAEYFRQVFWSSAIDLPENLDQVIEDVTLDTVELPPGEKALLSLQLPAKLVMLLDPVTHMTQFLEVKGEPTRERQSLSLVFRQGASGNGHDRAAARGHCACRSKTAPTRACCPGCGWRRTGSMSSSAGASRSSAQSGC